VVLQSKKLLEIGGEGRRGWWLRSTTSSCRLVFSSSVCRRLAVLLPVGDRWAGAWELVRQIPQQNREKKNQSKTYCPLSLITSTKTLILILRAGVGETPQKREVTVLVQARPAADTYLGRLMPQQENYRAVSNTGNPGTTGIKANRTNALCTFHPGVSAPP